MKARATLLLLMLVGAGRSAAGPDAPLAGDWVGQVAFGGKGQFVKVGLKAKDAGVAGTIAFPARDGPGVKLENVRCETPRLRFEWKEPAGRANFDGMRKGDRISGEVTRGAEGGRLELARVANVDSKAFAAFAGLYEFAPGRVLAVGIFPAGPVYLDFHTGRTGVLFPRAPDEFFAGPAFLLAAPPDETFTFTRDGQKEVTGLVRRRPGASDETARRLHFRRDEVTFRNGDVTLAGTLVLPPGKGPHPAMIRIGGAGPSTRRNFIDEFSAYHGIAFLAYDKRGSGSSTGDWQRVGVEELAGDALAGVRLLKGRPDIDARHIALGGGSEGGWVAAAAAARDPDVAMLFLAAGPALSFVEEVLCEVEDSLRDAPLSAEERAAALEFFRTRVELTRSGEVLTDAGWKKLQAAADRVRDAKWFPYVRPWRKGDWRWEKWHRMSRFDPRPLWEKTTVPVFALYGERDRNVPPAPNAAALEQALKRAGNRDYTIRILPKANHEGMEAETGLLDDETTRLRRHVPGYLEAGTQWMRERVGLENRPRGGEPIAPP